LKFRRQEQIGRFIVDFVCYERKVTVEADGGRHAMETEKDAERTRWLNSQGFTVLRFWNNDILSNIDGALQVIVKQYGYEADLPPSPASTTSKSTVLPS
jgi:very-short-patch-repair endonuclease